MQRTSEEYKRILALDDYYYEVSVVIGDYGTLITERNERILFANEAILVSSSDAGSGYRENMIWSMTTTQSMFKNMPEIGNAIAGEIEIRMTRPAGEIQRMAQMRPFVRILGTKKNPTIVGIAVAGVDTVGYSNEDLQSEWLQKGVYYIDTREYSANTDGLQIMTLHGFDAMLMTECDYPSDDEHDYPLLDITMVEHIASSIGVSVDPRTYEIMTLGYEFPLPAGYSSREVLCMIAAAYCGTFIMSDIGELRLVQLNEYPKETAVLIDHSGATITFGVGEEATRILVS